MAVSLCHYPSTHPATWPDIGDFVGNLGSHILSGSYLTASSPDQAEVTEVAFSTVLSNDFSGSEISSRRYLYGTFHGSDIRISFSRIWFKVYNMGFKRNNTGETKDSLPRTTAWPSRNRSRERVQDRGTDEIEA